MIIDVKDVAITIACIECMQNMHIEMRLLDCYMDRLLVAASCKCGKFLGEIPCYHHHKQLKFDRREIRPISSDDMGAWGCEMREQAQQRMQDAERLIAAATWAKS